MSIANFRFTQRTGSRLVRDLVRLCWKALAVTAISLISIIQAQAEIVLDVEPVGDFNFGVWASAGSLSASVSTCVNSLKITNSSSWFGGRTFLPYNVRVTSLEDSGNFYLYKNGDSIATGNQRIAVSFRHKDLIGSGGDEVLQPNQMDAVENGGNIFGCILGWNNSRFTTSISSQQLDAVANGYYTGNFRLDVDNRPAQESVYFSVSVSIQGSSEVRVSRLDDVSFGEYNGPGALQASEHFCVYSADGAYRISVSSANQDAAGNFFLHSNDTGQQIPLDVRFADSGVGVAGSSVGRNSLSGKGNTQSTNCGGADNATLTLSMLETDLAATRSGRYSDTLVILVQPE